MTDSTERFSSRVENYRQYRPGYPPAILITLQEECRLTPASVVADIGSGTGLLTEVFLRNGNPVLAMEPNRQMREAGERLLHHYPKFQSVAGTAEATTLADRSVDFITAGQAFHWFDRAKTKAEFARLLKPGGWIILVWNERQTTTTPFLQAYEQLLKTYALDYERVNHRGVDHQMLADFFGPAGFRLKEFSNDQVLDFEGLKGRLLSSSYTPEAGHPHYQPMLAELDMLFQRYQVNGRVVVEYATRLYYGQWS